MTKRRAKFRRHSGKMIKLFKDLFDVPNPKTSLPMESAKMRPLKLKLTFVSLIMATFWLLQTNTQVLEAGRTVNSFASAPPSGRQERARKLNEPLELQPDPMEPCYLANNRASETLTISESTPVGTIVGELMIKGDSSRDGNIELSIKMPGSSTSSAIVQTSIGGKDRGHSYTSTSEALKRELGAAGTASESSSRTKQQDQQLGDTSGREGRPKSARHLGNLIDLMPPLSIEQDTKRLILAKRLDRENLERYIQAGSFQSSFSSVNSLSQASSGSLTVHIKCELKEKEAPLAVASDSMGRSDKSTNTTLREEAITKFSQAKKSTRSSGSNSILIPIHLIVTDENDNWPSFIGAPYIIDLNETAPLGSLLPGNEIVALDNDQQGPLSTIEYSIVPGSFYSNSFAFLNPLDARSLIVKDNRALDYEAQSKIQLKVMARDQGEPPNWAITSLFINLLDQDDLGPVFERDQYRAEVKENRPGELVELLPKRLLAHDGDKQLAAPVSYAFHLRTNQSVHFELEPDLGHLRLKKALPEQATEQPFCLLVRATQVDNEQRSSLTAIQLRLATKSAAGREDNLGRFLSANNHSSRASREQDETTTVQFAQPSYTLEMSESAPVGATVFTARAGHSPAIAYQLLDNELGILTIEPQTGRVKLNRSLDFELFRQISVRILATLELHENPSSAYPKLSCDITRLQVTVLNFNDFTPEFSHEQYNFQLSISDLIASFEPQATRSSENTNQRSITTDGSSTEVNSIEEAFSKFGRRLGDAELDEASSLGDLPDYRAIQLGQVYCADRDFGDKVTLALAGNKAHLFRLTQDGRLYLPLVNVTSEEAARASSHERQDVNQMDSSSRKAGWGSHAQHQISNKLTLVNRAFLSATRRNDPLAADLLDRNHLNYLLSELGQLGRLRLKVHAADEGRPTPKQSSALVVVSIISIDNFIIQRAQGQSIGAAPTTSLSLAGSDASVQLTNDTSYQTGAAGVMMIPSMDGRSFVHINPDIIGNLLAGPNSTSTGGEPKARSEGSDSLELAASNQVASAVRFNESRRSPNQQASSTSEGAKQQPPSLLLVDEEGAKFVAMPAAIEVYQQQVQEAAEQQTREKQARQLEHEARSSLRQSIWHFWTNKLNTRTDDAAAVHWLNLSTAVMLHLVVVGAIVMLLARLHSSLVSGGRRDHFESQNSNLGPSSDPDLWPRRLGRLSSYFGDKSSPADQAASILTRHQASVARSSYGQPASRSVGEQNQYAAFLGRSQHGQRPPSPPCLDNNQKPSRVAQSEIVSSAAVVSAISNKMQTKVRLDELPRNHQQNLFDHLKLTLNKMLDTSAEPAAWVNSQEAIINRVSMRPLDSDVVAFEDMRDRELEACAQLRETSELQLPPQRKMSACDEKAPVSTFVSASISANSISSQRSATTSLTVQNRPTADTKRGKLQNDAVVSINIKGPSPNVARDISIANSGPWQKRLKPANKQVIGRQSSSNSSVISLVSMSSTLSNKINEAVGRAGSEQANGSDLSSLNSSILLNGVGELSSCSSAGLRDPKLPLAESSPAQPPQLRTHLGPPKKSSKPTFDGSKAHETAATTNRSPGLRQQPPENPAHVRLRRQAMSEAAHEPNAQEQRPTSPARDIGKAEQQVAAMSSAGTGPTSVGGRREARIRTKPPTPPPMPSTHDGQNLYGQGKSAKTTTVSPTTSVDRGYESFQSYSSACMQQQRTRQFNSLPDQDPRADTCKPASVSYSLPSHNQSRPSASKYIVDNRAAKRHADSPVARAEPSRLNPSSMRHLEGDTEDDDFYYCCTKPVHSSEHHQLQAGGLLSDYANHTYQHQQQMGRPSRAQRAPSQGRQEYASSSSRSPAWKSVRVQTRLPAEQSHSNTRNDLIPLCEQQLQQHQVICDINGQSARHQHVPAAKSQRGRAGRSSATGQSSQRPLRDYYAQPSDRQGARFLPSCAAVNESANGANSSSNKKQLTWFDQVEADFE